MICNIRGNERPVGHTCFPTGTMICEVINCGQPATVGDTMCRSCRDIRDTLAANARRREESKRYRKRKQVSDDAREDRRPGGDDEVA